MVGDAVGDNVSLSAFVSIETVAAPKGRRLYGGTTFTKHKRLITQYPK